MSRRKDNSEFASAVDIINGGYSPECGASVIDTGSAKLVPYYWTVTTTLRGEVTGHSLKGLRARHEHPSQHPIIGITSTLVLIQQNICIPDSHAGTHASAGAYIRSSTCHTA